MPAVQSGCNISAIFILSLNKKHPDDNLASCAQSLSSVSGFSVWLRRVCFHNQKNVRQSKSNQPAQQVLVLGLNVGQSLKICRAALHNYTTDEHSEKQKLDHQKKNMKIRPKTHQRLLIMNKKEPRNSQTVKNKYNFHHSRLSLLKQKFHIIIQRTGCINH